MNRVIEFMKHLDGESFYLGFDWFGPEFKALPERFRVPLLEEYAAPTNIAPLGLEIWLKAAGAHHVETTTLLSHKHLDAGFGSWAQFL